MLFNRRRKRPKVVPSFQTGQKAALAMGLSNRRDDAGEFAIALIRDHHARQGVIPVGIESRGNQHELGLKRSRSRNQHLVKNFPIRIRPCPPDRGTLIVAPSPLPVPRSSSAPVPG